MMEKILHKYAVQKGDPAQLLAELVNEIRPPKAHQAQSAAHAIQALCYILNNDIGKARLLRDAILHLLGERKPVSLLVDSGIQPNSGFFTEMCRRFSHKLLPAAVDPAYLKDLFAVIFSKPSDETWVLGVPDAIWLELLQALHFEESPNELIAACQQSLLDAVQVLSYRLSASGLEPELVRSHPELEDHTSPFIIQNVELGDFLATIFEREADARHLLVMLDQCREVIAKIRRNSSQSGTSIQLTFLLQRMTQQIERLEILLKIIGILQAGQCARLQFIQLFKSLVEAECHKNDVRLHWQQNMELLALRVTENASRTGEHYITETRSEYFSLMRSAMGAGIIVAFMAMIKLITAGQHYAPLTEAILFSLNYGLGFVLIHILHFTVATKQPAMTAAAIAASINANTDNSQGKVREMDRLVEIIAQTMRSQMVAILGNVLLVVPVAMLIAYAIYAASGHHFVSPQKATALLTSIHPLQSGALFYAAIAGVCLFLSGLIAGYHDNISIYNKIPQRIRALRWLQKLLGTARLDRISRYIENNLGALAGNFYFGCLLGGMSAIGVLLGLPVDIRHITFSSAFVGFSLVGLEFSVVWQTLVISAIGVGLIGAINLGVSFTLALYVAMKSRKIGFGQWPLLMKSLLARLVREPRLFFLPPKKGSVVYMAEDSRTGSATAGKAAQLPGSAAAHPAVIRQRR